jgi:hypothetical protein
MMNWDEVFEGEIGGRPVKVEISDEGDIRVHTSQAGTGITEGGFPDDTTHVFSEVIPAGACIEIEVATRQELEPELQQNGFTPEETAEILENVP